MRVPIVLIVDDPAHARRLGDACPRKPHSRISPGLPRPPPHETPAIPPDCPNLSSTHRGAIFLGTTLNPAPGSSVCRLTAITRQSHIACPRRARRTPGPSNTAPVLAEPCPANHAVPVPVARCRYGACPRRALCAVPVPAGCPAEAPSSPDRGLGQEDTAPVRSVHVRSVQCLSQQGASAVPVPVGEGEEMGGEASFWRWISVEWTLPSWAMLAVGSTFRAS